MAARGLGKGLDALIPSVTPSKIVDTKPKKEVTNEKEDDSPKTVVKITMVKPNREQPRKNFDDEALEELAESIKKHGLLQPILVQDRNDYYEIIAGERRWRAAMKAGLKEVPVIIKNLTEQEIVEIALIENIQREDLNPIEEALAYKRLLTEFNLKQEEVAERVSKSRTAVTNSMRLLKLDEEIQKMVENEELTTGHARSLLSIDDPAVQLELAKKIIAEKLSVRDIEKLVKNYGKTNPVKKKKDNEMDVFYKDLEDKLKGILGTKVSISSKGEGNGEIRIEFYSHDELDKYVSLLSKTE